MRYFACTAANRTYSAGGQPFVFELVGPRGGSWLGILAVEEPAASTLAAADIPQIGEISEERYNDEKKKLTNGSGHFQASEHLSIQEPPSLVLAEVAGSPTPPTSAEPAPKELEKIDGPVLETTEEVPPSDPILEDLKRPEKAKAKG